MKLLLVILDIVLTCDVRAQDAYDQFQRYFAIREQNKNVSSVTELFSQDNQTWTKHSVQLFNPRGLPTSIVLFDDSSKKEQRNDFVYDSNYYIRKVETYKAGRHVETAEFETNDLGQVILLTEYVYSSYDGEKMFLWKTTFDYYPNHVLKQSTRVEGQSKPDTVEMNFFDSSGSQTRSFWSMRGLRTTKTEFIWNKDKTELKELHYENDSTVYNTTVHKYRNGKEIERIDPSTARIPFYWQYDEYGRVIETNEALYFIAHYEYDSDGRLQNKTWDVLFSDGADQNFPKKMYYKYEYKLRR